MIADKVAFVHSKIINIILIVAVVNICCFSPVYANVEQPVPFSAEYQEMLDAQEKAEDKRQFLLTEQVFTLVLPLRFNDVIVASVSSKITGTMGKQVLVEREGLLAGLRRVLEPPFYQEIVKVSQQDQFIALETLQQAGLDLQYDSALLELILNITSDRRQADELSLFGAGDFYDTFPPSAEPAPISGYIVGRARADYVAEQEVGGAEWLPFVANFEFAERFGGSRGVVLEGDVFYQDRRESNFERGGIRLVHDRPEHALRFTAGDVNPQLSRFQGIDNIGGLTIGREYAALQPNRVVRPTGQREFILDRQSDVDVFVNGILRQRLSLTPGRYNLTDFTFFDGVSDVRIEIIDDAGNRQTIEFSAFSDSLLLREGIDEFSITGGLVARPTNSGRVYDQDDFVTSGFYRRGVTENLTLGANLQNRYNDNRYLAGTEIVYATPIGVFDFQNAVSRNGDGESGHVSFVNYRLQELMPDGTGFEFDLSGTHRSREFADVFTEIPFNPFSYETQSRIRYTFPEQLTTALSGRYAVSRELFRDEWSTVATVAKGYGPATLQLSLTAEKNQIDNREYSALVSLTWNFGFNSFAQIQHNTADRETRADYFYQTGTGVDTIRARLTALNNDDQANAAGNLRYRNNRFDAAIDHDVRFIDGNANARVQRTRFTFETAIAHTDKAVTWGRPIFDSFVIFDIHENLQDKDIAINPSILGNRARSDGLGNFMYSELSSYRTNIVDYRVDDLAPGYSLGDTRLILRPYYRSGYTIKLGTGAYITIVGSLLQEDGEPVGFAAGRIVSLDNPEFDPIQMFTNAAGRFAAQGLEEGRYQVILQTNPPLEATISVSDVDGNGYINLQQVTAMP